MSKSIDHIDEQAVIDLTKRLVKSESVSGNEKKLVTLLAIEMKKAGFNLVQYEKNNNNIVGVLPGSGKGKTLCLVGHIDTVPEGGMKDAFNPKIVDGSKFGTKSKVLTGRGTCDMKTALAAMISAAGALKRSRSRMKGDFIVVGLANTKTRKNAGLQEVLKKFDLHPDFVVSGAPTNLEINTAHPGQAIFEIITKGKMANIGNRAIGENAILKMNNIIDCLVENVKLPKDERFGQANMIISSMLSKPVGESHSVPNLCQALLVRQYFANEDPTKIKDDFYKILKKNGFKKEEILVNLHRAIVPYKVEPKEQIIDIIQEVRSFVVGKKASLGEWTGYTTISDIYKIDLPVVGIGPGDEKYAHTAIEHVPVDQIALAAKIYSVLGERICVAMKDKS
jgi:acetylornithine deacetylase/succinyl-diaminopimelate desuccinylase-like protein